MPRTSTQINIHELPDKVKVSEIQWYYADPANCDELLDLLENADIKTPDEIVSEVLAIRGYIFPRLEDAAKRGAR